MIQVARPPVQVLHAIVSCQKNILSKLGESGRSYLGATLLPSVGLRQELCDQYCRMVTDADPHNLIPLRNALKVSSFVFV